MQTVSTAVQHRKRRTILFGAIRLAISSTAASLALTLAIGPTLALAQATRDGYEAFEVAVGGERGGTIKVYVRRPAGNQAVPVVVGLHGCGGLLRKDGRRAAREADWADRWVSAGYAVAFPDSFNPRGYRQICTDRGADRPIRPRNRADDAMAVAAWLKSQAFVDATRVALVGWSNGGSTVLHTVERDTGFATAVAFYPGCRPLARRKQWAPRVPLTILIGDADNWTAPEPCRELAAAHRIELIEYPGAVHGFDAPNTRRHTRSGVGLSANGDGKVEIGTDPKARAAAIDRVTGILAKAFAADPR